VGRVLSVLGYPAGEVQRGPKDLLRRATGRIRFVEQEIVTVSVRWRHQAEQSVGMVMKDPPILHPWLPLEAGSSDRECPL